MEYEDAGGYEDEEEILSPEDIMLEYEDYDPEFYTGQPFTCRVKSFKWSLIWIVLLKAKLEKLTGILRRDKYVMYLHMYSRNQMRLSTSWLSKWNCFRIKYLYYYSRFVTARSFVHRVPTTMFGVSMDSLWPTDQRLIASFWIPASEGPEGFWREIQNFPIFFKTLQYGCQWTPLNPRSWELTFLSWLRTPRVCGGHFVIFVYSMTSW